MTPKILSVYAVLLGKPVLYMRLFRVSPVMTTSISLQMKIYLLLRELVYHKEWLLSNLFARVGKIFLGEVVARQVKDGILEGKEGEKVGERH